MKITLEKTQYYNFAFEYKYSTEVMEYCRFIKSSYGWKDFNFTLGKWRFNNPTIIFLIQNRFPSVVVTEDAKSLISREQQVQKENIATAERADKIRKKEDSKIKIPGIKGDLRNYQKIGVEFFINNKGRAILADDMGTGKTVQTLGYILTAGHKRTLIICPASVKYSWEEEIKKWTNLESYMVTSQSSFLDIPYTASIIIINYDILKKYQNELMKIAWDCLVLDEAQFCKSLSAIRTKVVKQLSKRIKSILLLSGTPLMSRPVELYSLLNILDSKTWNNFYTYAGRYCDGHRGKWGYEAKGATNLAELTDKISRYFLRRTKDQVLKELPSKNFITIPVELTKEAKKDYQKASMDFVNFLKENKKKKEKEVSRSLQAEKLVKINYLREISVMGRLQDAKELINSIIETGEKVLVFSSFNAPLEELNEEYLNSVIITGKTPAEDRGKIVKQFQTNPDTQVFLGGYLSAGVGITLTAATHVLLLDMPWRPSDKNQAIDRAHRIGSKASSINIYQFLSKGTIDDFMLKLLDRKQKIFDAVVGSQEVKKDNEDILKELIKFIEEGSI